MKGYLDRNLPYNISNAMVVFALPPHYPITKSSLMQGQDHVLSLVIHHIRRLTKSLIFSPTQFIFLGMLCSMSNISHSITIPQHLTLPSYPSMIFSYLIPLLIHLAYLMMNQTFLKTLILLQTITTLLHLLICQMIPLKYLLFLPFHLLRSGNLPESINLLHISVTISVQPYLLPTSNAMQLNILAYLSNIKLC